MFDYIMIAAFPVFAIYKIYKNRYLLKKFSKTQIVGIALSYLAAISLAFVCIYYFGNWAAGFAPNSIIKFIISMAAILASLLISISILNKVLEKLTNGVLPKQ
ncbi:hypothetical protein ACQCVP_04335 [Rossellomorea vietnamensis]|uniref:hypothetical protein n=1 Tax=Rossellomorea vietnamensis TaxID=218284 RepID=UPI003CE8E87D